MRIHVSCSAGRTKYCSVIPQSLGTLNFCAEMSFLKTEKEIRKH